MIIFPGGDVDLLADTTLSLNGFLVGLDLDGVTWLHELVDGWSHGGSVDTAFSARPGAHGLFDAPMYRRGRIITVSGVCIADTRLQAEDAADALAAVLADGSLGEFAMLGPQGLRTASVRLSDTPQSAWLDGLAFQWQMQFTAPDHRKYGDPFTADTPLGGGGTGLLLPFGDFFDFGDPGVTGQITVTNDGTAPTEPTITISGPLLNGFQVTQTETGRRLVYPDPVSTDLVIDNTEGTAISGGQDRSGGFTVDQFFTIGPGQSSTFQFSTLGAETATDPASMTVTVAPAYH